ncbi:hypothetical protein ACHAQH_006066 [Verticillium albo-atrum]
MAGQGESINPMKDEDYDFMMATLGMEAYGGQGQPAESNIGNTQAPTILPPAGGGRQLVANTPVPMALLNSPVEHLSNNTYPQQVAGPFDNGFDAAFGNSFMPGRAQGGQVVSNNFLPSNIFSTPARGLPALQDNTMGNLDPGLFLPAGVPQHILSQAGGIFPVTQPNPFDTTLQDCFNNPAHSYPAYDPDPSALEFFANAEAHSNTFQDTPTEESTEMNPNVPSSAFFEGFIGDRMHQADRATRQDEIRTILNKDKVSAAIDGKDEAVEKGKKQRKRRTTKLEPGEKRRAPEMVDVLPYNDPPIWPPRRRKSLRMTEAEKEEIDASNADLDRQMKEWNKKKNNESAKRGRQRRQNRLNRLTEDLAQAQAERNFWKARAVAQGAGADEWNEVPEDAKDDVVADFRINPDDLLLPPEDDF